MLGSQTLVYVIVHNTWGTVAIVEDDEELARRMVAKLDGESGSCVHRYEHRFVLNEQDVDRICG